MTPTNRIPGKDAAALRRHLDASGFQGLVVLIGASGSGKSHQAAAFRPDQIASLDHYRALASGHFSVKFSVLSRGRAGTKRPGQYLVSWRRLAPARVIRPHSGRSAAGSLPSGRCRCRGR